jgi:hypothetical protein
MARKIPHIIIWIIVEAGVASPIWKRLDEY